jgi:hypothetical protein
VLAATLHEVLDAFEPFRVHAQSSTIKEVER